MAKSKVALLPATVPEPEETQSPALHDQISALAYRYWTERGCPIGSPEVDWLLAEEEIRSRQHSLSAVA